MLTAAWVAIAPMSALGQKQHSATFGQCPLYPQKQTLRSANAMSALCQKWTFRLLPDAFALTH